MNRDTVRACVSITTFLWAIGTGVMILVGLLTIMLGSDDIRMTGLYLFLGAILQAPAFLAAAGGIRLTCDIHERIGAMHGPAKGPQRHAPLHEQRQHSPEEDEAMEYLGAVQRPLRKLGKPLDE